MYTCIYTNINVDMYTHKQAYRCAFIKYTCTKTQTHVHTNKYTHVNTDKHVHIYTHLHIQILKCTHKYMYYKEVFTGTCT